MSLAEASLRPHPLSRGRGHHPIPFLRPFDSAQGERNSPHLWKGSCLHRHDGGGRGEGGSRTAPTRGGQARNLPQRGMGEGRKANKGVKGQVLDSSRGLGMTWGDGEGRDELAVQSRPPLDPSTRLPPRRICDRVSGPSRGWIPARGPE